jgi:hypothetical protein
MSVTDHAPEDPAGKPHRFPVEVALGILLLLVGAGMTFFGFAYTLSEVTGWPTWLLSAGLLTVLAGTAIIEWRLAARFYGRGPLGTALAVFGGIVVAVLFILVALTGWLSL